MSNKVIIDLYENIMPKVKRSSELWGRQFTDGSLVIHGKDEAIIADYFEDFIPEFKNETGRHCEIGDYEDAFMIEFTEKEVKAGMNDLNKMIERVAREYLLMRWVRDIGRTDLINLKELDYEKALNDWRYNSAKPAFVTPKYHPYF